jgi:hypothetical protein
VRSKNEGSDKLRLYGIIDFHGIRAVIPHKRNSNAHNLEWNCMTRGFGHSLSFVFFE